MDTFKFGIKCNIQTQSNKIDCAECKFNVLHICKKDITNTSIHILKRYYHRIKYIPIIYSVILKFSILNCRNTILFLLSKF